MAIIHCPVCNQRISSLSKVCPHCAAPMGELTPERRQEMVRIKHKRRTSQAKRVSLLGLLLTFAGAMGWWFEAGAGWQWPPPEWAVVLLMLGLASYLIGRGWLLWLYLTRSTVKRLL